MGNISVIHNKTMKNVISLSDEGVACDIQTIKRIDSSTSKISCVVQTLKSGLPYQLSLHRSGAYGASLPQGGDHVRTTVESRGVVNAVKPNMASVHGGAEVTIEGFGFTSSVDKQLAEDMKGIHRISNSDSNRGVWIAR